MFSPFFALAALSPGRQRTFRQVIVLHLVTLLGCVGWTCYSSTQAAPLIGYVLLSAGMVEGAALVGWRLTQLPKSKSLEFLLVTPIRPFGLFLAEALVGLALLALVTLSGLPVLVLLMNNGILQPLDLVPFLVVPYSWGAVVGLGLTAWAYESLTLRCWAERFFMVAVVLYLIVGVLAGEHLGVWIGWLPGSLGPLVLNSVEGFHRYNPFAVLKFWLEEDLPSSVDRMIGVEIVAVLCACLLVIRAGCRLQGHFQDCHYRPAALRGRSLKGCPDDRPLSWWAVRRVTEYSGRVNLWLAGGFGILYALYAIAGKNWPSWLGRRIFMIFDDAGGVPMWATALVVLAAVPAAFQYGLWDSNKQERCRRLELLLLSRLTAYDYWHAAAAAAWQRGRGYFAVALLLWTASALTQPGGVTAAIAAGATGVLLWALYFAVGFRGFARGVRANSMGIWLTIALPAGACLCHRLGWTRLAALLPPGTVYYSAGLFQAHLWLPGALLGAILALIVTRRTLASCEEDLRGWYNKNHGRLIVD